MKNPLVLTLDQPTCGVDRDDALIQGHHIACVLNMEVRIPWNQGWMMCSPWISPPHNFNCMLRLPDVNGRPIETTICYQVAMGVATEVFRMESPVPGSSVPDTPKPAPTPKPTPPPRSRIAVCTASGHWQYRGASITVRGDGLFEIRTRNGATTTSTTLSAAKLITDVIVDTAPTGESADTL